MKWSLANTAGQNSRVFYYSLEWGLFDIFLSPPPFFHAQLTSLLETLLLFYCPFREYPWPFLSFFGLLQDFLLVVRLKRKKTRVLSCIAASSLPSDLPGGIPFFFLTLHRIVNLHLSVPSFHGSSSGLAAFLSREVQMRCAGRGKRLVVGGLMDAFQEYRGGKERMRRTEGCRMMIISWDPDLAAGGVLIRPGDRKEKSSQISLNVSTRAGWKHAERGRLGGAG